MQVQEAYDAYAHRMFLPDSADAPKLRSNLNNNQFLDAISAPSSGKGSKKKITSRRATNELIEISDESDDQEEPNVS